MCNRVDTELLKSMIFILNPNLTSLSFYKSPSFNMVLEFGLIVGLGFKTFICNLLPIC